MKSEPVIIYKNADYVISGLSLEVRWRATRWAFLYLVAGASAPDGVYVDPTEVHSLVNVREESLTRVMHLCGFAYSSTWSMRSQKKVRRQVVEVMDRLISLADDSPLWASYGKSPSRRINSPAGCGRRPTGIYVENSGIDL